MWLLPALALYLSKKVKEATNDHQICGENCGSGFMTACAGSMVSYPEDREVIVTRDERDLPEGCSHCLLRGDICA